MSVRRRLFMLFTFCAVFSLSGAQNSESLPHYPDWMYQKRLAELDKLTPIHLDYNAQTQAYIEVYTVKRRNHLANIIGRSELYFPLFEEYLAKYDLPLELKYLAIVESALDPKAKSSSGAMGLWQFLYHASRMFDLEVNTYVDERCDPIKSTEAACKYLKYLHHNLNDWQLALAAYNGGLGVVQKAIERSGGKTDFWELQPYLPAAVKSYVPAFIAVNYVMNNYDRHEVTPNDAPISFNKIDTVVIHKSLSFEQICTASDTDIELIRWLNPAYTKDFVPVESEPVGIFLPKEKVVQFIQNEKLLKEQVAPIAKSKPVGDTSERFKSSHKVQKGEFFHKIAIQYQCRISDVMHWNKLRNRNLLIGQQLVVWKPKFEQRFFFVSDEIAQPEKLMWKDSLLAKDE
ncbi:transglycosylase SLT domain-containing protein [Carboxylicivirga sp. N1Y90]|uniref:lytic transglycosylase domain-containing protein n=1 Tax=Carboxylicivirga fragile TaxID=3417571 RepID=UPI003D3367BA|nr:transglycosylase SLT domain-containing protein [Marinilabiliaceae bacterium N1Y90]